MNAPAEDLPPAPPLLPGTVIRGRYELADRIGRSGAADLYRAYHLFLRRQVLVRIIEGEWSQHPRSLQRLQSDIRRIASIGHPNVAQIFDADILGPTQVFVAEELLLGETLEAYLARKQTLSVDRALAILRDLARGLRAAHAVETVHGDVRPATVMRVRHGGDILVKIVDFRVITQGLDEQAPFVTTSAPIYMAPEQLDGRRPTTQCDVYGLGALFFEMLCGRPPFTGSTPEAVYARKRSSPPLSVTLFRRDVPSRLVALMNRCLMPDPADRPTDAAEFLRRLREAVVLDPLR